MGHGNIFFRAAVAWLWSATVLDERPELACHFLLTVMPQINQHLRDANRRLTCSSQLCRAMQDEINSINFDNKMMADLVTSVRGCSV